MINESKIVKEIQKDENIRYFKLPEDNGWNSGRAVLISQVQTEYFVTCDDDFVFKDATRTGMLGIFVAYCAIQWKISHHMESES